MSLSETLLAKGVDLIDDKGEEWLGKVIGEGRKLLDTEVDGETAKAGHDALELLDENKQPFVRLGKVGFAQLVAYWEDGEEAEARRQYLATSATYAERRAAMHEAGDAATKDADERKAAWEAVEAVLKKIGTVGLQFIVGMIAKSLGIPL